MDARQKEISVWRELRKTVIRKFEAETRFMKQWKMLMKQARVRADIQSLAIGTTCGDLQTENNYRKCRNQTVCMCRETWGYK
jgi:hypothetical protein